MSMFKRSFAIILAAVMILAIAGCGGGGNQGDGKGNDSELVGNTYVSDFPIVKEPITLTILTTKQPTQMDYKEMPFSSYYEDLTNVHIEWQLATWGAEATQKIQLAYMSDAAPDIVSVTNKMFTDAMIEQYSSEGKIADLSPYIEKWAPNIKTRMDAVPDSYAMCTASNGILASLPTIMDGENHMRYGNKPYIRKTWLDALGLEIPTTVEEYYNVLKAFKEQDPNGNGLQDEVPLVFQLLQAEIFSNWGINYNAMSYGMMINQSTGKWEYALASDNMRDAIKFYSRLYDENLLSQKVVGEPGRYESTIKAGNVGVFYGMANFVICDYELAKEYVMLPPLKAGDYPSNCYYSGFDTAIPNNLVISSKCKNVEAALRWFDYFYTPQGYALLGAGVPGDEGIYRFTEDGKMESLRDSGEQDVGTTPGGQIAYGSHDSYDKEPYWVKKDVPDSELSELALFNKYLPSTCTSTFGPYIPKYTLKYPRSTMELGSLLDDYATPLNDYANQMLISFLVGVKNIDSEWGSYITELKRMNLDEIVSEYQKAYDATYSN